VPSDSSDSPGEVPVEVPVDVLEVPDVPDVVPLVLASSTEPQMLVDVSVEVPEVVLDEVVLDDVPVVLEVLPPVLDSSTEPQMLVDETPVVLLVSAATSLARPSGSSRAPMIF